MNHFPEILDPPLMYDALLLKNEDCYHQLATYVDTTAVINKFHCSTSCTIGNAKYITFSS